MKEIRPLRNVVHAEARSKCWNYLLKALGYIVLFVLLLILAQVMLVTWVICSLAGSRSVTLLK